MQTHILDYLTDAVRYAPDKTAYSDGTDSLTFREVYEQSRSIGTFLCRNQVGREPVVVFMEKHPRTIAAFYGVISAGAYYVPIDVEMPVERIRLILENVQAGVMICDAGTIETARTFAFQGRIVSYEECCHTDIDEVKLEEIYEASIDTDPIYIVFTSGSTGVPKGVTACHRSVIDYIEHLAEALPFAEDTVFGNQAPLYMDACLRELLLTLKFRATAYLIPRELFLFPVKLVEYLNQYRINTICWVVSALVMISSFDTFQVAVPEYLRLIAFVSEVFPIVQFHKWKEAVPNATYVNLYGPTEATGVCCYYIVDREFQAGDVIPIGRPFRNTQILLLDEQNREAAPGESGEICIRGSSLTLGYYNDLQKTSDSFTQNPLHAHYPERIYRTGDIGRRNDRGELEFVSRKDYQIKHMGHRIELGEIEANVNLVEGVKMAGCVYDKARSKIVLFYTGTAQPREVTAALRTKVPRYMLPNKIIQMDRIPLTANGKINRLELEKKVQEEKKDNG